MASSSSTQLLLSQSHPSTIKYSMMANHPITQCLPDTTPPTLDRTCFDTRATALRLLVESRAVHAPTNTTRPAHPWIDTRTENNHKHKQQLDQILDTNVTYIEDPTAPALPQLPNHLSVHQPGPYFWTATTLSQHC